MFHFNIVLIIKRDGFFAVFLWLCRPESVFDLFFTMASHMIHEGKREQFFSTKKRTISVHGQIVGMIFQTKGISSYIAFFLYIC